jgi:hypothetical protein
MWLAHNPILPMQKKSAGHKRLYPVRIYKPSLLAHMSSQDIGFWLLLGLRAIGIRRVS